MTKEKWIYTIVALILIFMFIVVTFIRDEERNEDTDNSVNEDTFDETPRTTKELLILWYEGENGSVKIPKFTNLATSDYKLTMEKINDEEYEVQVLRNDIPVKTLSIDSLAPLETYYSTLLDDALVVFDIRYSENSDCNDLESETDREECRADFNAYAGIWKYDIEMKEMERILGFEAAE